MKPKVMLHIAVAMSLLTAVLLLIMALIGEAKMASLVAFLLLLFIAYSIIRSYYRAKLHREQALMKLKVMSHAAIAALALAAFFALALFVPPIGAMAKEAGMAKERALFIITFFAAAFLIVIGSMQDTHIIRRIDSMISSARSTSDTQMLSLFIGLKSCFRKRRVIIVALQSVILMLLIMLMFVLNVKSTLFAAFLFSFLFFLILSLCVFYAVQDSHIKSEFERMDKELDKKMMAALEKIPGCSRN